jgi:uncharacterized protein (TIGR02466 family)
MPEILRLFPTLLYRAEIAGDETASLNADIEAAARSFARDDKAGRKWCAENGYPGYTSYGSLNDLPARAPCFALLKRKLEAHAAKFSEALALDLAGGKLKLDNLWVNVLEADGFHSGHIHPHCVLSGTYYARAPKGAAALKLEDPRLPLMMAAPMRGADGPPEMQSFHYVEPREGLLLMWESWLRHEVVRNASKGPRVSVSFNFRWS